MKDKKPIIIAVASVMVAAAIAITAFFIIKNNNKEGEGNSSSSNGSSSQTSNDPKSAIVGKWMYYDEDFGTLDFTYTFNADGTGNYTAAGNFTYKIDGNKITINYDNAPFETEFEIKGDTLNIKDSIGNDTLYKRVK